MGQIVSRSECSVSVTGDPPTTVMWQRSRMPPEVFGIWDFAKCCPGEQGIFANAEFASQHSQTPSLALCVHFNNTLFRVLFLIQSITLCCGFGRRFWELLELDRIVNVRSYMAFCLDGEVRQSGMGLQKTAFDKCFPLLFWHCESFTIFWTINTDSMDIT